MDKQKKEAQPPKRVIEMHREDKTKSCMFLGDTDLGKQLNLFFDSVPYTIFSSIIMIVTLFADDIREVLFPPSADIPFSILNLICITIYLSEMVVLSLVRENYFLRYYFWLDSLSTVTMVFDLVWITNLLTNGGRNAANIAQISKASRAARLGSRTIRLIRIFRMIKLMKLYKEASNKLKLNKELKTKKQSKARVSNSIKARISSVHALERQPSRRWTLIKDTAPFQSHKLTTQKKNLSINCIPFGDPTISVNVKSTQKKSKTMKNHKSDLTLPKRDSIKLHPEYPEGLEKLDEIKSEHSEESEHPQEEDLLNSQQNEIPPETKVASRIKDQIQKNIILMIILILVSVSVLDANTWFSAQEVYAQGINEMEYFAVNYPGKFQSQINVYIPAFLGLANPLIYFSISDGSSTMRFPSDYPAYISQIDISATSMRDQDLDVYYSSSGMSSIGFNINGYNVFAAQLNIGRTLFICALLLITTMLFSHDIEAAALEPLQEMFETVRKIAIHPLNALREIEQKNMCLDSVNNEKEKNALNTEPKILQNTIVKIGSLLAVGFGEAGTQIICRVIEDPSIINVMIPGRKMMAIFGFCDIRNFTDATEILEADVMVFVNNIADICHRVVYQHLGSPNKNIGDAFLLVWKFMEEDVKEIIEDDEKNLELLPTKRVKQMADLAVLSFVRMIAEITKSQALQKYKNNKKLQARIKDYKGVKMGFGMHVGWAIEGPIGSEYKIDASYLSPHVHMASRLEGATKQYGASMLITGEVYSLMTDANKVNLRHIDKVIVHEDQPSLDLYTVDVSPAFLFKIVGVKVLAVSSDYDKKLAKVYRNMNRHKLIEDIETSYVTEEMWRDQDVLTLRSPYSKAFYECWEKGFHAYLNGNWVQAVEWLNRTEREAPEGQDGPTAALLAFISEKNGIPPPNWDGVRMFN